MPTGSKKYGTLALDSSVIFAILLAEPEADNYLGIFDDTEQLIVGAPTLAEVGIVVQSREGPQGLSALLKMLQNWNIDVIHFDKLHAIEAIEAHKRFGRGNHPAKLNMGDCNSYVVARIAGVPLLYKGNDFALTDLLTLTLPEA